MKSRPNKRFIALAQHISDTIGLNYLIAEAERDDCQLILRAGSSACFPDRPRSYVQTSPTDQSPPRSSSLPVVTPKRSNGVFDSPERSIDSGPRSLPDLGDLLPPAKKRGRTRSTTSLCTWRESEQGWDDDSCVLPYCYDLAFKRLVSFLSINRHSIVKLQMCNDAIYPVNKNIILYVPVRSDTRQIRESLGKVG